MNTRLALGVALVGLITLAACNKAVAPESSTATTSSAASAPAASAPPETAAPAEVKAPSSLVLADGTKVQVVTASVLDGDPKAYTGLVAITGEVSQVFAEKGTFMLKDCPKDADCKTEDNCSCCSKAEVPVRLVLSEYTGNMPQAQQEVVVIAEVSPTGTGYTLAVREVRLGEKAILTRKA